MLKPVLERIRVEGVSFLQNNAVLAAEIRRTFIDLDQMERELKKASKAVKSASGLLVKYKEPLGMLCDAASANSAISGGTLAIRLFTLAHCCRGMIPTSSRYSPESAYPTSST
jgi:hypothetical protein